VANVGHVDDGTELTLAAATAAIITARWNGAGQRRRSEPDNPLPMRVSNGGAHGAPTRPAANGHGNDAIFAAAEFEAVPEVFAANGGSRRPEPDDRARPDGSVYDAFPPVNGASAYAEPPGYDPASGYDPSPPYETAPSYDAAPPYHAPGPDASGDSFPGFAPVPADTRPFDPAPFESARFESAPLEPPPFQAPSGESAPVPFEPIGGANGFDRHSLRARSDGFAAVRPTDAPVGFDPRSGGEGGGFQTVPREQAASTHHAGPSVGGFVAVGGHAAPPVPTEADEPDRGVADPRGPMGRGGFRETAAAAFDMPPLDLAAPPPPPPPPMPARPAPAAVAPEVERAPVLPPAPPPLPLDPDAEAPVASNPPAAPVAGPRSAGSPVAVVPTQRSREADFGFAGSVMSDLEFPAPFEVEPFEPGWVNAAAEATAHAGTAVASRRSGPTETDPLEVDTEAMLPQRVPGVPDVPEVPLRPNDPLLDPGAQIADGAELSRIATYLRDDTVGEPDERPDGFDLAAVLTAVQGVPGVRDANLRWNSGSGHTLRIEFDDQADEGQVTREVARLLRETMGLAAAPNPAPGTLGAPPAVGPDTARRGPVVATASVPVPPGPRRPADQDQRGAHPMPPPAGGSGAGPRVVLDHVQVTTLGVDATVEVRLVVSGGAPSAPSQAVGRVQGPAVDAYLLRLAAGAAGDALDQLLVDPSGQSRARCFVEHVAVVPFAGVDVAVVVLLLVWGSHAEQHSGSAIVAGDPRQAVVRATLSAVNRRLQSLLS
jgi:hypothetical protein